MKLVVIYCEIGGALCFYRFANMIWQSEMFAKFYLKFPKSACWEVVAVEFLDLPVFSIQTNGLCSLDGRLLKDVRGLSVCVDCCSVVNKVGYPFLYSCFLFCVMSW